MRDVALSINFYLYNLTADERQRGSHEIVQSRDSHISLFSCDHPLEMKPPGSEEPSSQY
jgi:hypothetical protein